MAIICPTVLADTKLSYDSQLTKVASLAHRLQIDLADGLFAPNKTIDFSEVWWPVGVKADIHLMYQKPEDSLSMLLAHKPNMIILHAEADGAFEPMAKKIKSEGVMVGLALLAKTSAEQIVDALDLIDHVLIFSGDLGHFGGSANLELLSKIGILKQTKPTIEIGWDGGVNDQNVSQLILGGVDVLNVGGFIQNSDDPAHAYSKLDRIAAETGAL